MIPENTCVDLTRYAAEAVLHRRYLHAHPELSFEEHETQLYITDQLRSLGIDARPIAGTGVTAVVHGASGTTPDRTLLLRADIDALPLMEQTGLPFSSENPGVMHACGHDGHAGALLAAAHWMVDHRSAFGGAVRLLFQPAEELSPGGAEPCVQEGVLRNPSVTFAFGVHLWSSMAFGAVGLRAGVLLAEADRFNLTIEGRGAHAAQPHLGVDPIVASAHVITSLQSIVARETDPLASRVVTIGTVEGGSAFNVIPDAVRMTGTLRALSRQDAERGAESLRRIATLTAEALGAKASLDYQFGYPPVINSRESVDYLRPILEEAVGKELVVEPDISMGGEDFAYYLQNVPGAFVLIGTASPAKGMTAAHHSPTYTFDEDILLTVVRLFTAVISAYLA